MRVAITREVSPALARCELTHLPRVAIDLELAREQHAAYERCLAALGCSVLRLAAGEGMPDAVFVEDVAVVFDELAVATRPGAASRRGEVAAVADALESYRPVRRIEAPGTLDGGDVLRVGRRVLVGCSGRTNAAAVTQLRALLAPHGYTVREVPVDGCLHLKTAVTAVADDLLLVQPRWVAAKSIAGGAEVVEVHPGEPFAANALRVGEGVVFPAAFPRTRERLEPRLRERGLSLDAVEVGELAKAEGGVTCCSVIFEA